MDTVLIRNGTPADFNQLAELMYSAVHNGSSPYTAEQRTAWMPEVRRGLDWSNRLSKQKIFVACAEIEILGFITLAADGYIDLAFVGPDYQRKGVFRRLYQRLEIAAREAGVCRLWVHASVTARPAFAAMEFCFVEEQLIEINGQTLQRYAMEKHL